MTATKAKKTKNDKAPAKDSPGLAIVRDEAGPRPAPSWTVSDLADARLADHVADRMRGAWCWTSAWSWMHWTGVVWKKLDPQGTAVTNHVRHILMDDIYAEVTAEASRLGEEGQPLARRAARLLDGGTIRTVTTLIAGPLTEEADAFDTDAEILVCANGVLDLRTRELLPHDPARLVTRSTGVDYLPEAMHPVWARALEALADDETRAWFQRRMGLALIGHLPPDLASLVWLGGGRNGKSGVLRGLARAFGDYAVVASPSILEGDVDKESGPRPDLMAIRGRRLVVLEELSDDPRAVLSLTAHKRLTSGQEVPARELYQGQSHLTPTWSIVVAANVIPPITETDDGSWRRMIRVPAPYRYVSHPVRPADRQLDEGVWRALDRGEGVPEAVLAWLVEGLAAAGDGSGDGRENAPAGVQAATEAWREESDAALAYIRETLEAAPGSAVLLRDLTTHVGLWLKGRAQTPWSEVRVRSRIGGHDALADMGATLQANARTKKLKISRPSVVGRGAEWYPWERVNGVAPAAPAQATVIKGVRFRG